MNTSSWWVSRIVARRLFAIVISFSSGIPNLVVVLLVRGRLVRAGVLLRPPVNLLFARARQDKRLVPVGVSHVHQDDAAIEGHQVPGVPPFENVELEVALDDAAVDSSFLQIELEENRKMAANPQPLFEIFREHDALVPEIP